MDASTNPNTNKVTETLPPYKVILHNDSVNRADAVVDRIVNFVRLERDEAIRKALEAHEKGRSVLIVTHLERAELIQDRFNSCQPRITTTIEKL